MKINAHRQQKNHSHYSAHWCLDSCTLNEYDNIIAKNNSSLKIQIYGKKIMINKK